MSHSQATDPSGDVVPCQRAYPHEPPHQNFDVGFIWTYPDDDAPATLPAETVAGVVVPTTSADVVSNTTTAAQPVNSFSLVRTLTSYKNELGLLG